MLIPPIRRFRLKQTGGNLSSVVRRRVVGKAANWLKHQSDSERFQIRQTSPWKKRKDSDEDKSRFSEEFSLPLRAALDEFQARKFNEPDSHEKILKFDTHGFMRESPPLTSQQ